MFINTIEFPPIKNGMEEEFLKWFEWSNNIYKKFDGLISRRLLKSTKGKEHFLSLVEHESEKTFMAMHTSEERKQAFEKLKPMLEGALAPRFYEVVSDSVWK